MLLFFVCRKVLLMLQLGFFLRPQHLAPTVTHMHKIEPYISLFWTQTRISFFLLFSFFMFFVRRTFIISRLFIRLKRIGFLSDRLPLPASPFQLDNNHQVPLTLFPFLPACNIAQSPYFIFFFVCMHVVIVHLSPLSTRVFDVFLYAYRPLSHPVWCWNKDRVDER